MKSLLIIPLCLISALPAWADESATPNAAQRGSATRCPNVVDMSARMQDEYSNIADHLAMNELSVRTIVKLAPDGGVTDVQAVGTLPEVAALVRKTLSTLQCQGSGKTESLRYEINFEVADNSLLDEIMNSLTGSWSNVPDLGAGTVAIVATGPGRVFMNQKHIQDRLTTRRLLAQHNPASRVVLWGPEDVAISTFADTLIELEDHAMDWVTFDSSGRAVPVILGEAADRRMSASFASTTHIKVEIDRDGKVAVDGKPRDSVPPADQAEDAGRSVVVHARPETRIGAVTKEIEFWAGQANTWVRLAVDS